MTRLSIALLVCAACGRLSFEPAADASFDVEPFDVEPDTRPDSGPCVAAAGCRAFTCGSSCYTACPQMQTWAAAQATCQGWGGCLATIDAQTETDCLDANTAAGFGTWIGLTQSAAGTEPDEGWSWVCGGALTFVDWSPGEPSDSAGGEDCGEYGNALQWNDRPCTDQQVFLCER